MGRARDIASLFTTSSALATDSEVAALGYLTNSSASSVYLTQGSASSIYTTINSTGLAKIVPSSVAVGSGTGSATALGTVTFSGVSSVSLNGVFSSAYENYKLVVAITDNTVDGDIWYKNRVSNADASSSYYWGRFYIDSYTTGTYGMSANNSVSYIGLGRSSSGSYKLGIEFNVYRPQIAAQTTVTGLSEVSTGASSIGSVIGGAHTASTSYDSCSVGVSSGTITGTVSVYGYK
jgi:hypothetical protein